MDFSFDSIKTELQNRLSLLSQWKTTIFFGVYERIMDTISYITEKTVYIAEFLYKESNWMTATKRESLMYKSKFLSYYPHRRIGAYGKIIISADDEFLPTYTYTGETVIIPVWTEFTNIDGDIAVYCIEQAMYYKNTVGNVEIKVKEGIPKQFTYIAQGIADEIVTLFSNNTDNEEIEVFIVDGDGNITHTVGICGKGGNPEEICFVNDLTNYYCEVYNSYDFESIKIKFGDGINSRKLTPNERILIKYAETKGDEGNIQSTGVITKIKSTLLDANSNEVSLFVVNNEAISDGSSYETIINIKNNGRRLFQTGYRCGGTQDWISILESISYVFKVKVWGKADIGDIVLDENQSKIYITAITTDGTGLTQAQKDDIVENHIKEKKSITDIISWEVLNKLYVSFKITGKITNLPFDIVGGKVRDVLYDKYSVLKTDFKVNIYESNFFNIIDDVDEILYHHTEIYNMEKDFSAIVSGYEIMVSLLSSTEPDLAKQIYIVPDTFELWIKRKVANVWQDILLIGHDSGGTITGDNGYTINGGSVVYADNKVSFTVQDIIDDPPSYGVQNPGESDPTGYIISMLYKTKDGDGNQQNAVRLKDFNSITDVDKEYTFYTFSYL